MGIFDNKKEISRDKFRDILRKHSGRVPFNGTRKYTRRERVGFEKKMFPFSRYGSKISDKEYNSVIRNLKREKFKIKDRVQRSELEKKIEYLERLRKK